MIAISRLVRLHPATNRVLLQLTIPGRPTASLTPHEAAALRDHLTAWLDEPIDPVTADDRLLDAFRDDIEAKLITALGHLLAAVRAVPDREQWRPEVQQAIDHLTGGRFRGCRRLLPEETVTASPFDVPEPGSDEPMTAEERRNLAAGGFDLYDDRPKYGQKALLQAYRAGFHDGRRLPGVSIQDHADRAVTP